VELQDQLKPIQDAGGRVVAVSTDALESSRSLASQLHLGYPILQDRDHALGSAFDVFHLPMSGMDMGPVDSHSMFVVDANGRVAWKKLAADTMHVSVDEVVNAVKAA
jgi:peroxiredoxin